MKNTSNEWYTKNEMIKHNFLITYVVWIDPTQTWLNMKLKHLKKVYIHSVVHKCCLPEILLITALWPTGYFHNNF